MARATFGPETLVLYDPPEYGPIVVFRVLLTDEPENPAFLESLRSNYEQRRPPRRIENRSAAIHMGLSCWQKREQAVGMAQRFPVIGEYVGRLELQRGKGFNVAETGLPGHLTVWGRPDQLAEAVVDILAVEEA